MAKKNAPKKTPAIQAEQLEAIRRLARQGRTDEATNRLDALKRAHPRFKPLFGLAWEIADSGGDPHSASLAAWEWTEASPNSAAAWEALAESALAADYLAMSAHARGRRAELDGSPVAEWPGLTGPFGEMSFAECLANDRARLLMSSGRFEAALAALGGFDQVPSRNNAALARLHQGDVAGALAGFEQGWQREPRNLFALGRTIRLRTWLHGLDSVRGLAAPMAAARPERVDDALAKIHALLFLGDSAAADAAWREASVADYADDASVSQTVAMLDYAGGVAALRLGDFAAMEERLSAAKAFHPRPEIVEQVRFSVIGPAVDVPLGDLNEWFPGSWIERLHAMRGTKGEAAEAYWDGLMQDCSAHVDYLGTIAELGGELGRMAAISILKWRARSGENAAVATLIGLLARPCGPDKARTELQGWLSGEGLLPKGATVSMLVAGKLRDIQPMKMTIHAEVSPPDLPPASFARLEEVFGLVRKDELPAALGVLEELIERHPDKPSLYNNLAGIMEALKHPDGEIEALFEKAHALDPDYLFAASGLARIAARRGDLERAKALLAPLFGRDSYHFTEWRSILMTQQVMAVQQGDLAAAQAIRKNIEDLQERFG